MPFLTQRRFNIAAREVIEMQREPLLTALENPALPRIPPAVFVKDCFQQGNDWNRRNGLLRLWVAYMGAPDRAPDGKTRARGGEEEARRSGNGENFAAALQAVRA